MILLIGRDGVLASMSLTVTRRRSAKTASLAVACSRPYSSSNSRSFSSSFTSYALGHPSFSQVRYRFLSSLPPASVDKSKLSTEPLPPLSPLTTNGKKAKVELRPAPVKPNPSDVFPKSSSPVKDHAPKSRYSHTTHASDTAPSTSSADKPTEKYPHREGVIESAQHDFEAASSHGILAPPPPGANKLQTLIHQAKEFFKFYWNGLKLINTNRVRANRMRARVTAGGPALTRWETRFIKTYKEDALKLIPFALIIIIAEEAIPFVVMWAPFLLPSTCILPAQRERIAAKKRAKQQTCVESMSAVFKEILERGSTEKDLRALLNETHAKAISGLLAQSSYTYGFPSLRVRRIQRHLASVAQDDTLLLHEGFGERLTDAELREALEERGILTDGMTSKEWRSRLQWWLTNTETVKTSAEENIDPIHNRVLLIARSGADKF